MLGNEHFDGYAGYNTVAVLKTNSLRYLTHAGGMVLTLNLRPLLAAHLQFI
jgi:hypothetical protein